jgi:phosphatidate cytidylyltransferase
MLRQRILTALAITPVALLVILWLPHPLTAGVLALVFAAGAWEWSAFPGFTKYSARLAYVAMVAACIAAVWLVGTNAQMDRLVIGALVWWCVALLWVTMFPASIHRTAATFAGFLVLVPAWVAMVRLHSLPQSGPQLLFFLILLVVAADVGAYFAGRRFGRNKLAPRVSPGKTWEGVAGGVIASSIMAAIGAWWFNANAVSFIGWCAVVVLASILGDLTESLFKRHAGLKDSGSLLPGHGGVLDRVDSLTAAAPVFLIGLERFGLLR